MYTSFYNLHSKPFQISSDPKFMWFGEKHQEALATLKYGILDNKGFLLLTGDVGTGKTSLINALIQSLNDDIICTSVPDPSLEKMDFFNYIAAAFGIGREFLAKGTFLAHFREFLLKANDRGKKVLLIIDEAQLLTQEMLEEIRLLSNIEKTDTKLINIFFIGQNEFNEILNRPQNRAVRQRLTLNYNLDPLTPDETHEYIKHRLKIAGTQQQIFDVSAVQEIFLYSGGFPRRINILCDHSLLSGYVKEQETIDGAIVKECAKELKIPAYVRNRDINGFTHARPGTGQAVSHPPDMEKPAIPVKPYSPPSPPRQSKEPEKNGNLLRWGMVFVFFLMVIWVFFFPVHFKKSVSLMAHRINLARQALSPMLPDGLDKKPISSEQGQVMAVKESHSEVSPQAPDNSDIQAIFAPSPSTSPGQADEPDTVWDDQNKKGHLSPQSPAFVKNPNHTGDDKVQIEPIQEIIVPDTNQRPGPESDLKKDSPDPAGAKISTIDQADLPPQKAIQNQGNPPPLITEKVIVRFQYNTNDFTDKGFEQLESFSKALTQYPDARILITGYTDSEGYANYNKKLSEFRANIVKSYLLGKGIGQDQIQIRGLGGDNPIETNATAWGRMMNRRVEIEVLD